MTANELADKLDKGLMNYHIHKNLKDSSTMLRQQAEEIEKLERRVYVQTEIIRKYQDMLGDADFEIQKWKSKHDILAVTSCACGLKKASEK